MATRRADAPPSPLAIALSDLDRLAAERPALAPAARTLGRLLRAAFDGPALDQGNRPDSPLPSPPLTKGGPGGVGAGSGSPAGPKTPLNPPLARGDGSPRASRDAIPHADPDLIIGAWRAGVPAFRAGEAPPSLDVAARVVAVCAAFEGENPAADALSDAVRAGKVDPAAWASEALAGSQGTLDAESAGHGLDPALVRSVLRLALLPALAPHSARLDALRPEGAWAGEGCPNCGNPPSLAESRGLDQRRSLRCGVCAGDWPGDRLRCPFCGETDHRRLGYAFIDGEGDRHRLAACDSCGARLKVVSTLRPLSAPGLLVAELAMARLDGLADADLGESPP